MLPADVCLTDFQNRKPVFYEEMYYRDLLLHLYKSLVGGEDYNNNIIRKHSKYLENVGEFSFSKETLALREKDLTPEKPINLKEIENELVMESKNWELHLSKCVGINNSVHIFIDRVCCFRKVVEQTLQQRQKYGSSKVGNKQKVILTTTVGEENLSDLHLKQLRLLLLKDVTKRLLQFNECEEESQDIVQICLSNEGSKEGVILCGPVLCLKNNKHCSITAEEFYKKRTIDMRLMAEHKYGLRVISDSGWQIFFEKLGQAAVTIDLLQNKSNRNITINLNNPASASGKGASFILYNCARLATLFKEFEKRVSTNVYPALPSYNDVDFSLLVQPEEWELLFTYVLQFPHIVNTCIRDISSYKINTHNLCSALSGMCLTFSIYYRRVRVLTEPRTHLFAILHARIYLLKAVEQVLHNGLYLLNIQPVNQM